MTMTTNRDVAPRYSDPFSALRAEMDTFFVRQLYWRLASFLWNVRFQWRSRLCPHPTYGRNGNR